MSVAALTVVATALVLADNTISFVVAVQLDIESTTNASQTVNRTSKALNVKYQVADKPELNTTGRKYSGNDYSSFSSMTSDLIVEASSIAPPNTKKYPSLTTNAPTFITRSRYIRKPFYFNKDDQEVEFEDADDEHEHAELFINAGMPKWNRFNTNHRQLNKYGAAPIEADITVDEDGSTGYGSMFDFGGDGGYDSDGGGGGGYPWSPGAGAGSASDSMAAWYSEPMPQATRPVPIIAEIRRPAHLHHMHHKHMPMHMKKMGMLALLKLALLKLKALKLLKLKLLLLFKIKLLLLVLAAKMLMLLKLAKMALLLPALLSLLSLPALLSRLSRLGNSTESGSSSGGEASAQGKQRRLADPLGALDPGMVYFKLVTRDEKCVERVACRVAAAPQPSITLIWLNWAALPISNYIPSKKIRSFVSTFTEVTNYRLDNMYSRLLPSNWTEWCNNHYNCDGKKNRKITTTKLKER